MNGGVSQAWPLTSIVNFAGLVAVSPPLPFHPPGVCFILQWGHCAATGILLSAVTFLHPSLLTSIYTRFTKNTHACTPGLQLSLSCALRPHAPESFGWETASRGRPLSL